MTDDNLIEMTTAQVADILGISERAVIYKIKDGELKGSKPGKSWVVYYPKEGVSRKPAPDASRFRAVRGSETSEKPVPSFRQFRKEDRPAEARYEPKYVPKNKDETTTTTDSGGKKEYKKKFDNDFRKARVYMQMETVLMAMQGHDFLKPLIPVLSAAMEKIAVGYTIFGDDRKIQFYNEARDWLAVLIHRIHVAPSELQSDDATREEVIAMIQKDTLGLVVSLLRSAEIRKKDRPRR